MTARHAKEWMRRIPVELPAALLAGIAVAFWLTLAPSSWFERFGLALTSGARTPVADAARVLLALVGFALAFALTRAGLRALEPRRAAPADMPQFRKADLHPDAPRRRPIRAAREFGAPELNDILVAPTLGIAPATVPLPSFLRPTAPDGREQAPIRFVDDIVRDVPDGVAVSREPIWFRPRDPDPVDESGWEDADWEAIDDASAPELPTGRDIAAEPPAPVGIDPADENVVRLMARLEAGLARRGSAPVLPARDPETRAALDAVARELDAIFPTDLSPRAKAAR